MVLEVLHAKAVFSPTGLRIHHRTVPQLPLLHTQRKSSWEELVLPTTIVVLVISLLRVALCPDDLRRSLPNEFLWFSDSVSRLSRFLLAAVISLVPAEPLTGPLWAQFMDSVCQSTNLTIMNDLCAAGTAPCITSPHGKTNDGGMPEKGERP